MAKSLEFLLALDNTKFNRALNTSQDKVTKAGRAMAKGITPAINKFKKLSTTIGLVGVAAAGVAAVAGAYKFGRFMRESIELAGEQEAAETKLAAVIKATGGAAGFTAEELNKYAGELQDITTTGDEVTISAMAMLATFKQIKGDEFKRATMAALDMSAAMDTIDLSSAIVQIGKALNDPIKGMNALSRSGVRFTKSQVDMVKQLQTSGDLIGAQTIILKELEGQFGGTAAKLRGVFGGALVSVQGRWFDLKEEVGKAVTTNQFFLEGLKVLETQILSWTEAIEQNGPAVREFSKQAALSFLEMGEAGLLALEGVYRASNLVMVPLRSIAVIMGVHVHNWSRVAQAIAFVSDKLGITTNATEEWATRADKALSISADQFDKLKKNILGVSEGSTKIQAAADALEKFRTTMEKVGTEKVENISKPMDEAKASTEGAAGAVKEYEEELILVNGVWQQHATAVAEVEPKIDKIVRKLDALDGKQVTVTINERTVQQRALGGLIHTLASGGKLAGFGGGDRIPALLEAGEYVIRKEAVARFGSGIFHALNNLHLPELPKFATGGGVSVSPGTAMAAPNGDNLTFNFNVQSANATRQNARELTNMIMTELQKRYRGRSS